MVGAILAAVAFATPAAEAACGGVESFRPTKRQRPGPPPLAVGDSVMLGAVDELRRAGFEVNVRGCRQMSEGLRLLRARRRAGSLPDVVVVALGANWTISAKEIRSARRILGPARVLGMVTPRELGGARTRDQVEIRRAGRRWPARVKVLDWVAYSAGKSWTWDGLHLKPAGAAAFTRLLSRAFKWPIPGSAEDAVAA
jgi:hypothetical protein